MGIEEDESVICSDFRVVSVTDPRYSNNFLAELRQLPLPGTR